MLGLLLLMALLCDANSTCPDDSNPLSLDPSSVTGELGESFLVNCTSSEMDFDQMYWKFGNTDSDIEDEKNFVAGDVRLSDWSMKAECRIQLNATLTCSKDLTITVYKTPDTVSLSGPKYGPMVEGSDYMLSCDVINVVPVQHLKVKWYRGDEMVHTNIFNKTSMTPVNVTATLKLTAERNYDGAVFRCEAELHLGPGEPQLIRTAATSNYTAVVLYKPWILDCPDRYTGVEDVLTLDMLPCHADGNPPPTLKWYYQGDLMNASEHLIRTQSGMYTARFENSYGHSTAFVNVTITDCPLILSPAKAVVRFGDPVSFNCSTTATKFWTMGWETPNKRVSTVTWAVESLAAWSIELPCYVTLEDFSRCFKKPEVTLYKTPDTVSLSGPKYGPMVEGSDYMLSCDVISVVPVQHLKVKWYRGDEMVHTHIFNKTSMTPVNVTATLKLTAERDYDGAVFRCEAELHLGPGEPQLIRTAATSNYTAVVLYKPQIPNCPDRYTGVEDVLTLDMLPCHADGNPPATLKWYYQGDLMNASEHLIRTQSGMYRARFENSYGHSTAFVNVTITDCPLILSPAKAVVRFGDPVSFNCSTTATKFWTMGWETPNKRVSTVTWAVESLAAWSIELPCYVILEDFSRCFKKPEVTLYKTPDTVSLSGPKYGPMVEGSDYMLSCDVISVVPVQHLKVKWYRGDEMVHTHIFNKTSMTPVNVTATLKLTAERDYDGAVFRCEAELHLGPGEPQLIRTAATSNYTAVVLYKPQIPNCPDRYTGVEDVLTLDMLPCHADGNPPATLKWYYQGELMNASEHLIRTQSGMYTARFENSYGHSTAFVNVTVEYGPSFDCAAHYEVHEYDKPVCEPEGIPKPVTTWLKDGREMRTPLRWTKQDTGSYSLTATNRHGTASHMLYVNVLYIQMFREENYTQGVFLGENVTFGCHAEGKPTPAVYWRYAPEANVMESTGGSQSNISVTGATSTNAGVYVCVATNRVGNVTKSVTLKINDINDDSTQNVYGEQHGKTSAVQFEIIWVIPALLISSTLVAILLIVRTRSRRHGRYNFVPQRDKEGADIPMTTTSDA